MSHEHLVYDACEACIGYGVVVRTRREGNVMKIENVPCPNCEGLGILRGTERTEVVNDEDEE